MAVSGMAGEQSYKIVSVHTTNNAKVNGMTGICFRILADIHDCLGKQIYCDGALYYKDRSGELLGVPYCYNGNKDYARGDLRSESGFVPYGKSLSYTCESEASSHVFEVFIPYNAITHPAGHVEYQLELKFHEAKDNKLIKNKEKSGYVHSYSFAHDWQDKWPKEQNTSKQVSAQLPNSLWGITLGDSKSSVEQKLRNAGIKFTSDGESIKNEGRTKINVSGLEYHKITVFLENNRVSGIILYKICSTSTQDAVRDFMKQTEEKYKAYYDEELSQNLESTCQLCTAQSYSDGQKRIVQQYDITEKMVVMFSYALLSQL